MNVLANTASPALKRGKLILRDGVVFLILSAITLALFGVTLLLFRSFEQHREDLGQTWSKRGRDALNQHRPKDAVNALHTALSYLPTDRSDQLLLAQALADAGRTEEAKNYFLNLRDARPGDGFVNFELARLARRQGDAVDAVEFYRAAIFGSWEGDGVARRRDARLELADYLAQRGDLPAARAELLIAAGNAEDDAAHDELFGDRLAAVGDLPDSYALYKKALSKNPHDPALLARAGRVAYQLGNYATAEEQLASALERTAHGGLPDAERASLANLAQNSRRIPELTLSRDLPAVERGDHILLAAGIAQHRLATCSAQFASPPVHAAPAVVAASAKPLPGPLVLLKTQWSALAKQLNRRTLDKDAALQDQVVHLLGDTENQTAAVCGAPTGDDALVQSLATAQPR